MIQVHSEIGPLKKGLLHRPGRELERLLPESLDRLLFDDIPYLAAAQKEHDKFAQALRDHGAEVVYLEEMTAHAIGSDEKLRQQFVDEFIGLAGGMARPYPT